MYCDNRVCVSLFVTPSRSLWPADKCISSAASLSAITRTSGQKQPSCTIKGKTLVTPWTLDNCTQSDHVFCFAKPCFWFFGKMATWNWIYTHRGWIFYIFLWTETFHHKGAEVKILFQNQVSEDVFLYLQFMVDCLSSTLNLANKTLVWDLVPYIQITLSNSWCICYCECHIESTWMENKSFYEWNMLCF